jgi:PKD repeat protein
MKNMKRYTIRIPFLCLSLFLILSLRGLAQHECHAAFSLHQLENSLMVEFTDASTSPDTINSWLWELGDGDTSDEQNPAHTYGEPGTYLVCLFITDDHGCTSHACHHITVHHPPAESCHAAFIAHQSDPAHLIIDFTDQSTSDDSIISWEWDFGDGNSSGEQNPSHTYVHSGVYLVCLTITDHAGCTNHVCHQVTVHHSPANVCHAAFVAHQSHPGQLIIDFTDHSTADGGIISWEWDFGDGNSSNGQNPSHPYAHPGVYLVCLVITDDEGCSDHVCHHVTVHHIAANESMVRLEIADEDANQNLQYVPPHHLYYSATTKSDYIECYPNPFVSNAAIRYELTIDSEVKIALFDMFGHRILEWTKEKEARGMHTQNISADELNTGCYILQMTVGNKVFTKRIGVVE